MSHTRRFWVAPIFFLCLILLAPFTIEHKPVASETKAQSITTVVPAPVVTPLPQVVTKPKPAGLSLTIDAINLSVPLGKTRLDPDGRLMVPADASKAAWYESGPVIGEKGTALITGHVESTSFQPGVFYNLRKLKVDDRVKVGRMDGSVAIYRVDNLESYPQDNTFPWHEVYRTEGSSRLRLITCDGDYSRTLGRYPKNLVVYASLVSLEKPAN